MKVESISSSNSNNGRETGKPNDKGRGCNRYKRKASGGNSFEPTNCMIFPDDDVSKEKKIQFTRDRQKWVKEDPKDYQRQKRAKMQRAIDALPKPE